MKKRIVALAAILVLALSMSVHAAFPRITLPRGNLANVSLTFSNTTAKCSVNIPASSGSDTINAVIKLYNGGTCLNTWTAASTGSLGFYETYSVSRGKTYKLEVTYTINGTTYPTSSSIASCPN